MGFSEFYDEQVINEGIFDGLVKMASDIKWNILNPKTVRITDLDVESTEEVEEVSKKLFSYMITITAMDLLKYRALTKKPVKLKKLKKEGVIFINDLYKAVLTDEAEEDAQRAFGLSEDYQINEITYYTTTNGGEIYFASIADDYKQPEHAAGNINYKMANMRYFIWLKDNAQDWFIQKVGMPFKQYIASRSGATFDLLKQDKDQILKTYDEDGEVPRGEEQPASDRERPPRREQEPDDVSSGPAASSERGDGGESTISKFMRKGKDVARSAASAVKSGARGAADAVKRGVADAVKQRDLRREPDAEDDIETFSPDAEDDPREYKNPERPRREPEPDDREPEPDDREPEPDDREPEPDDREPEPDDREPEQSLSPDEQDDLSRKFDDAIDTVDNAVPNREIEQKPKPEKEKALSNNDVKAIEDKFGKAVADELTDTLERKTRTRRSPTKNAISIPFDDFKYLKQNMRDILKQSGLIKSSNDYKINQSRGAGNNIKRDVYYLNSDDIDGGQLELDYNKATRKNALKANDEAIKLLSDNGIYDIYKYFKKR